MATSINPEDVLTRKQAIRIIKSPRLFQRLEAAGWVLVARRGGRGKSTLFTNDSLKESIQRIKNGELPPLLPSEIKERKKCSY